MKRLSLAVVLLVAALTPSVARAEWHIVNEDANSYSMKKDCSGKIEDFSVAGGVDRAYSIPAGATSCTLTLNNTACTVKDGGRCVVKSGKISNG